MRFEKEAEKLYSRLEVEAKDGTLRYYRRRYVSPVLNRDGSLNYFNLITGGNYWRLFGALAFVIIGVGFALEYHSTMKLCEQLINEHNLKLIAESGIRTLQNLSIGNISK